mgnify:CR=1 FL=1
MCDPVSAGMFALNAAGQIGQHQAQGKAVSYRNRAKLRNFDEQNSQYLREVTLNNAKWKNDVQVQEGEQDQVYQAMVDQWVQQDQQLDKLFAEKDYALQDQIVKMYENDYAGTQTGRTAARLAGKSAKALGFAKAKDLSRLMLAQREADTNKDIVRNQALRDSNKLFEQIRFAPIHGHTPVAPELEAKPSTSSLILGLAGSALTSFGMSKLLKAPNRFGGSKFNPDAALGGKDFGAAIKAGEAVGPISAPVPTTPSVNFWSQPTQLGDFPMYPASTNIASTNFLGGPLPVAGPDPLGVASQFRSLTSTANPFS